MSDISSQAYYDNLNKTMNQQNKINGLLTQKPTSPVPHVGDTRRYEVSTETSKRTGNPWVKVKAAGEGFGKLYEVVTVEKKDSVDAHGNVRFNVDLIELSYGAAGSQEEAMTPQPTPTVHSTSIPLSGGAELVRFSRERLAVCVSDAVSILDSGLTALCEAATPDARLDAVLRLANTMFIQGNK